MVLLSYGPEVVVSGPAPGPCHTRPGGGVPLGWLLSDQRSTLMPIERAVPAMIFSAASIVVALRAGILVCAMSRTWAAVILPTLVLFGSALPLSTPAAFLISSGAGGVFVMKVKERSS